MNEVKKSSLSVITQMVSSGAIPPTVGANLDLQYPSHPKPFRCSVTPRSAKAEALIRSVEEEHPYEPSDANTLAKVQWDRKYD